METKIPEHRKNAFKAKGVFKPDELRRRREEQQIEIRRKTREESLAKRRNLNIPASPDSDDESAAAVINAQVRRQYESLRFSASRSPASNRITRVCVFPAWRLRVRGQVWLRRCRSRVGTGLNSLTVSGLVSNIASRAVAGHDSRRVLG
jgi:hypothetical protein